MASAGTERAAAAQAFAAREAIASGQWDAYLQPLLYAIRQRMGRHPNVRERAAGNND